MSGRRQGGSRNVGKSEDTSWPREHAREFTWSKAGPSQPFPWVCLQHMTWMNVAALNIIRTRAQTLRLKRTQAGYPIKSQVSKRGSSRHACKNIVCKEH